MSSVDQALEGIRSLFDQAIKTHGATPRGSDWNSEETQFLRFAQLLKLHTDKTQPFSIIDYGCGYGALVKFLVQEGYDFTYTGYDMTPSALETAQKTFDLPNCTWTSDWTTVQPADYVVCSGIFNIKFKDTPAEEWYQYMLDTVQSMWAKSQKGLSFNALTSYSDAAYMREDLYYPDPLQVFDFCKRNLSKQVALLHDYGIYDFTILVRR
jgi:SAM-dependent methyltransferase